MYERVCPRRCKCTIQRAISGRVPAFDKPCVRKRFDFILVEATRHMHDSPSLGPDQINEYASVIVIQVGQFVGEVGEIVADASLQVLGDVMVDRG
jgi:hypothetical protein